MSGAGDKFSIFIWIDIYNAPHLVFYCKRIEKCYSLRAGPPNNYI